MAEPIRVAVVGAAGRMGREILRAVCGDVDMRLVAAVDRTSAGIPISELIPGLTTVEPLYVSEDLEKALDASPADVLVDFSHHSVVGDHAVVALKRKCAVVIGATGLNAETLEEIRSASESSGVPVLYAPNFALGAILMMKFSEIASRWYADAEIIELHHERKEDAPSGTALLTAEIIANARIGSPTPKPKGVVKAEGALGGRWHDVPVHSIRLPGLLAHQQVMFGAPGETLTIRHDSTDRAGFMNGVKLAIREVWSLKGLVIGLDRILFRDSQ